MIKESYIDCIERDGKIVTWVRDESGKLYIDEVDSAQFHYLFIPDNTGTNKFSSMEGIPLRKVCFDSSYQKRQYIESHRDCYEADVPAVYRYLMDNYSNSDANSPVNFGFYDIEVDFDLADGRGYPLPSNPFGEINSISFFDVSKKTYKMFILHDEDFDLSDDEFDVKVYKFSYERDLLEAFAEALRDVDILCGWNSEFFDLPYIMARALRLFGNDTALTMFCRDGFEATSKMRENKYGEELITWNLVGRHHIDLLPVMSKFVPKERDSYSLDAICQEVLGMSKIQYEDDGDLGEVYRENPRKFFEYSLHDTRLLVLLDKKLNLSKMMVMFTRNSCVLPSDVLGSVKPIEFGLMKFLREKGNIVLPSKKNFVKEKFPGAIVYNTLNGRYGWNFTIDLTALYPSTMIMLGVSPETFIMQCMDYTNDFVRVVERRDEEIRVLLKDENEIFTIKAYELKDIIEENGYTISANGSIFNGELGLLSEYTKSVFMLRKEQQKKAEEYDKAGNTELAEIYTLMQSVTKILANSIYGATSNIYFRLYDIDIAKSITLTGQFISKFQAYAANEIVKRGLTV